MHSGFRVPNQKSPEIIGPSVEHAVQECVIFWLNRSSPDILGSLVHAAKLYTIEYDALCERAVQELACSLNRSSPGVPLLVLTVAGDISPAVEKQAAALAQLVHVDEFRFHNAMRDGRCPVR